MYENQTHAVILERMQTRVPDELDKRPSSVIYDTLSATAMELQTLYIGLEYLIKNSYGDTAEREFLIRIAKDRGMEPEPATCAVLKGVFTPDNINVVGRKFNIGEMNYTVQKMITPGIYKVVCDKSGTVGNRYLGSMIPMEYINGLKTAALTDVIVPGEDEEDTESFRTRYFNSFNEQSFGGNRADYLAKVKSINGVGAVKVERVWNADIRPADMIPNADTVKWYQSVKEDAEVSKAVKDWLSKVYEAAAERKLTVGGTVHIIIADSDDYGVANTELVKSIQQNIDPEQCAGEGYGIAPIGHVVIVESVGAVDIMVNTKLVFYDGYNWLSTKAMICKAVEEYFLELRKTWEDSDNIVVRISQIESRILAVKGVADIMDTTINDSAENLVLGKYEIPVLGGVNT